MKCRSLSVERHAVGALLGSGIGFVGTYHDLIQRAVVLCAAMVLTLVDGTLDAVVSTARMVHGCFLLRSMVRSYRSKSLGTCVQYFLIGENIFAEKIDTYINIGYNRCVTACLRGWNFLWGCILYYATEAEHDKIISFYSIGGFRESGT